MSSTDSLQDLEKGRIPSNKEVEDVASFQTEEEQAQGSFEQRSTASSTHQRAGLDDVESQSDEVVPQEDDEDGLPDVRTKYDMGSASWRLHWIAAVAEFCGTFVFLFLAYMICNAAGHAWDSHEYPDAMLSHPAAVVMIAFGFGFSLMVAIYLFGHISGGHYNPAVTAIMMLLGEVTPTRGVVHWLAQMCGGMAAGGCAAVLTPGAVKYTNTLGLHVSRSRGLFIEMFGTAFLLITILMTAVEERGALNNQAPVAIGVSLFVIHLALVPHTGCGVNPARSFGAALSAHTFPTYHWIYWVGPIFGVMLAWGMWKTLQDLDYKYWLRVDAKAKSLRKSDRDARAQRK
ncbi:hypothetical protein TBLA_0C00250 [Henningerozyma blattae CBS 6284]|uniref:Aquaporin n=1 Tax=Henningerozyma blattae (strain ATCC 34711 / CBS 6284 / DSM 70876 / NBRC 10599 / NRRL Y-10934 / UCD 77-7) TaxID=1071380 RepID=I2H0E0_HENB6|nr:hypothetical protein TBLA_0C00250 [Tetrapisispora blattae CBS 6284]CCH59842.1 hypothetical protein TBLA_0C00250 [Tetrapisispora blattae CBS 6284]